MGSEGLKGEISMTNQKGSKIGLALAGGGPEGAVYEIGALCALEHAISGLNLNEVDAFVGVSAGGIIGANLANGLTPSQMCRAIMDTDTANPDHPFEPEMFLTPAFKQFFNSWISVPRLLKESFSDYLENRTDHTIIKSLMRLGRALPVGIFDNDPMRRWLENVYSREGRTNDFRQLKRPLYIVATELDTGKPVVFGKHGMDHIPISVAVQASTALPGLYPPVEIKGRHYVDGVLLKTVHASTILEHGVDLVLTVNPIVPVDTSESVEKGFMRRGKLIDRGMPTVLSQTFRTMIHSRMNVGFKAYKDRYTDKDVVLFEPDRKDYKMFFTNIFSFSARKTVAEHAYRNTLENIRNRTDELEPIFEKYGLGLRHDVIRHPYPNLWRYLGMPEPGPKPVVAAKLGDALAQLEGTIAKLERQKA